IDVNHLDAELGVLEPLAADGALLRPVGTTGRFRISRPEYDHVAVLQAVLDRAVGLRLADAQWIAPMMDRAPVPALPAIGIVMYLGIADGIAEAMQGGEIVADIAPGMMRAVGYRHHAGAIRALKPLNFGRDKIERLVPRNPHIAGLAAIVRI